MHIENIFDALSKVFPREFVVLLRNDYEKLVKWFHLHRYENLLVSTGRIVETLFICLSHLTSKPVTEKPNLNEIEKQLMELPEKNQPSSVRIIIPRLARAIYKLRSGRDAVHINPVSPSYMDAMLVLSVIQWILAELIRVYFKDSADSTYELSNIINGIVSKKLPLVEEIEGDLIILESGLSAYDSILLLLYYKNPDWMDFNDLVALLSMFTRNNISTSLRNAVKSHLAYRKENRVYLTAKGIEYVEQKHGSSFTGYSSGG